MSIKELIGKKADDLEVFSFDKIEYAYEENKRVKMVYVCSYLIDFDETTKEYTPIKLYINGSGIIEDAFKPSHLSSKNIDALKDAIVTFDVAITRQAGDERNYGLLFHQCGYDGKLQNSIAESMSKKGVYIF